MRDQREVVASSLIGEVRVTALGYWLHQFTCDPCVRSWSRMPGHQHELEDECPECYELTLPHSITWVTVND